MIIILGGFFVAFLCCLSSLDIIDDVTKAVTFYVNIDVIYLRIKANVILK